MTDAEDAVALARGLQGLAIRMARGLNRVMGRHGTVIANRYHARSLRTPTEVRRAIVYVLGNARKHLPAIGRKPRADWIDPYSSAVATGPPPARVLVAPPTTWLPMTGYLRAGGRIRSEEAPSGH